MHTKPLPATVSRFFVASSLFMLLSFIFSMVNLGQFSLYLVPTSVILTTTHHITLVVLSKRRVGRPAIAHALDATTTNRPASPTHSNLESAEIPMVVRERQGHTDGTVYPSYTINVANCTITFLLALLWACGSWVPFLIIAYGDEWRPVTARRKVIPYFEGCFMICESLLLFWLFGLLVYHRKKQLRAKESIPMTR